MTPLGQSRLLAAVVAISALALAGCAPLNVRSYVERGIDFTQYRTYNWAPVDQLATGDPRLDNNPFFQERLQAAVETQLATKGFEKITSGAPDLLIHYHASMRQEISISGGESKYGYCEDCRPEVYDAGTLLIDFVDARTDKLLWRGWAKGSMEGVIDDQAWMEQRIDDAVRRILDRLPRRL